MKKAIFSLLYICIVSTISAQNFETYFENKTLRLDYTFIGNSIKKEVALDALLQTDQWAGRVDNLNRLLRHGNGQIVVLDSKTNDTLYMDAFSSLFQEWQTTEEAKAVTRGFEHVLLIPFPKEEVMINILFREKSGSYQSVLQHKVDPKDILIRKTKAKAPYSTIHKGKNIKNSINVVIVPEGYTEAEMDKFSKHAKLTVKEILKHKPFDRYTDSFNFLTLDLNSKDSGVSIPRDNIWKETLIKSHFDTFYSDRYLTTSHIKNLHNALSGIPYAHIIILANTDTYGGGGIFNSYTLTTTGHRDFAPVVVHEFGHSFAGLADEYFYEGGDILDTMYSVNVEPWEPNITTLVDFRSKWENLLKLNTPNPTTEKDIKNFPIGIYEGGGYSTKQIYRAAWDCRMRTNTSKEFCPACQSAIEQIIKFYTE